MLNIKIYLKEDGDILRVDRDFSIYAGEYQNKLLSFYVPKSLVASNYYFTTASDMIVVGNNNNIENYNDSATDSINLTALQFARKYVSRTGAISFSGTFYAHFNKEVSVGGKEYVLFSRTLPFEMTLNDTADSVDNIMVMNVINITRSPIYEDDQITGYKNVSYRIIATNELSLPILPSQYLSEEPVDDASEYSAIVNQLQGDVNQLQSAVDELDETKQDKVDTDILTDTNEGIVSSTRVVTAINQLSSQAKQNADAIQELEEKQIEGFRFIGSLTNTYDPTTQVNQIIALFPALYTVAGLDYAEKENGDTIIYTQSIAQDTDKAYRFIYSASGWSYYLLPPMELASNSNAGIIKGGTVGTLTVSIIGGMINDIVIGNQTISQIASQVLQNKNDIANGFETIGLNKVAKRASADADGNNIVNTYMTKVDGATKSFVKDYALPANYANLYFIKTSGYADIAPTQLTPQFTNTITNIGTQTVFSLTKTFTEQYNINKNNAIRNEIYFESNQTIEVEFVLTTIIKGTTASIIRSGTTTLNAGEMKQINFTGNLIQLGATELKVEVGDTMQQILQVVIQTLSANTTLDLYSNTTYPSTFSFSVASVAGGIYEDLENKVDKTQMATKTTAGLVYMWEDADGVHIWNTDPQQVNYTEEENAQGGISVVVKTLNYQIEENEQGGLSVIIGGNENE